MDREAWHAAVHGVTKSQTWQSYWIDWTELKPSMEYFEHYFASMWNECNCAVVWVSLESLFFGTEVKMVFSGPVDTAEFLTFVGILSTAL